MTTPPGTSARQADPSLAYARAIAWLREVDGRLMHKRDDPDGPDGWVAIVRTPGATGRGGHLILGFGDSPVAAVSTARDAWHDAWRESGAVH